MRKIKIPTGTSELQKTQEEEAMKKDRVSGDTPLTLSKEEGVFKGIGLLEIFNSAGQIEGSEVGSIVETVIKYYNESFLNLEQEIAFLREELQKEIGERHAWELERARWGTDVARDVAINKQRLLKIERDITTKTNSKDHDFNILGRRLIDFVGQRILEHRRSTLAYVTAADIKTYFHFKYKEQAYRLMELVVVTHSDKVYLEKKRPKRIVPTDAFTEHIRLHGKVVWSDMLL